MCHHRHVHRHVVDQPARRDPRLRASDAERESTVGLLREHATAGRLDLEELEQRIGAAYAARTHGELGALLQDLPARIAAPRARARRHDHEWGAFLKVAFVLVAIWALGGAGYFWPAWVLVWWAVPLALRSGPRLLRLR
jgi:hypothetical protein